MQQEKLTELIVSSKVPVTGAAAFDDLLISTAASVGQPLPPKVAFDDPVPATYTDNSQCLVTSNKIVKDIDMYIYTPKIDFLVFQCVCNSFQLDN